MKTPNRKVFLATAALFWGVTGALAQNPISLAHHSEFYLLTQYWSADSVTVPNVTLPTLPGQPLPTATADIKYKLEDEFFFGLGGAYHWTDRLAVRGEFTFGQPDYEMTWNNSRLTGTASINTGRVNLDYHIPVGAWTPFVTAGIGYLYIDTGVPSGPPEYYLWWDYYWGYTLVGTIPTYSETYFTYNAAAGVRYEINDQSAFRFSYGGNWMDTNAGTLTTWEATLSFNWKF